MPFKKGDIVARASNGVTKAGGSTTKIPAGTLGRICTVVSPGVSYYVFYPSLSENGCVKQFQNLLVAASGKVKACPPDC